MRGLFSFLFCVVVTTAAFAQETNCTNGLDDDGDGFIDCYDSDCALNTACDDIFIGNDATCTLEPPPAPAFTMTLDFASEDETTNHFSRMAIGDLDRDGIPEIITMNKYTRQLIVLNGNDGSIKVQQTLTAGATPEWEIAIANINDDNCAEIFFLGTDSRIYVYDCALNFLYNTNAMPGSNDPINFGIADFDGDGLSEIYCKDQVFDAHSGRRLIATTNAGGWGNLNGGPVAVDMAGDSKLELVLGLSIYRVNIPGGRGTDAGSLTLLNSRPEYFTRYRYNATSIADYNLDGSLDVIASGSTGCNGKNTTIFFWDVLNNTVRTYSDHNTIPGDSDYSRGWKNGTGRLNIADLDGDGQLNVSYVSGGFLYALTEDLTKLWRVSINEETSGYTGCTLFDFNGDGKSEIVYRDEQYLYIIDGTDGSVFNQQKCVSRTNREYPIVADVDADGATEICVTCGFDDALSLANFTTTSFSQYSHVRVFESAAEPWVPARRVWNQHGYFVVNVNDDLTIPIQQQLHSKEFSTTACRPGDPVGPVRPLNKFLNQSPFIDTNGCPAYLAPDLDYATAISFIAPTCPDLDFQVQFTITNLGEVSVTGDIPVSFYDSNPLKPGANKLTTITYTITDLDRNEPFVINETITSNGTDSLFVVLNDGGTTIPTPISLPNTTFLECNYDNVRGVRISPLPVNLTALEVAPHELCASPPTGAVRAFVPMGGGVENTADYNFYWFDGVTAGPIASADFTGPIYSGIVNGPYTVFALHKTANCSTDTAQVSVSPAPGILPVITINVLSNQTSCNPPNGQLEAIVQGGNSGYSFEWFDPITGSLGITTSIASNLVQGNYTVQVTRNGCTATQNAQVLDFAPDPDVNAVATPVVNCQNPNSGTVSATALLSGVPQPAADYTFDWYFYDNGTATRGSILPPIHGSGPTRTGLPIGFYEVVVTNNASQCSSTPPITIEITDNTIQPTVTITELAPQTSCDPNNPNGRLEAIVSIGGVPQPATGFTFEWFVGQNTLPANAHANVSGTNGSIAEGVKGGGQSYTVKVTTPDQCSATDDAVVTEILNIPVVTLISNPNGICDPALASSNFTGSVTATVTFGGVPVVLPDPNYTFQWFNGTQAIGAPRAETTPSITLLDSGFYTVVVTRTDLGCASTPETEEVTNTTILPVIAANANGSTNCDPLLANGSVQVTAVDGVPPTATYNVEWHRGNSIAGYLIANAAVSPDTLQGAVGRFYTALVTNTIDGCQNTTTVEVPDAKIIPVISLNPTPNGICNPALTNPPAQFSGRVDATVNNQVGAIGDYQFTWTDEETSTTITGVTGPSLTNRDSSYYTAVVEHLPTGCLSNPVTVEVTPLMVLPVITADANASTNCAPSLVNGGVQVTDVDGNIPPSNYLYEWHRGTTLAGYLIANSAISPDTLQGAAGRFYTVLVTDRADGCQSTATVEVPDDRQLPLITLSSNDNTICSGVPNGIASLATLVDRGVNVPSPFTGYTFAWETGATTFTLGSRVAGNYSLKVRSNATGCESDSASVDVNENFFIPPVTIAATNQTSCDNLNPNGILAATIDETAIGGGAAVTAGYTFSWENNGNPFSSPGAAAGATATINNLAGNLFYSVLVRRTATGCENTESVFLPEVITFPIVTAAVGNNVTRCDVPNGSVIANVSGAQVGYTFFWLNEVGSSQTGNPNTVISNADATIVDNGTYPNLVPGYYTVVARDNNTSCISQPVTREVQDATIQTTLTITPGPVFPSTCGASDGQMSATVAGGVGPFTMFWHFTGPINDSINFYNNPPQFTPPNDVPFTTIAGAVSNLTNLESRLYTLVVRDNGNGCGNYQSVFLPFINAHTISTNLTPSTICPYTIGNGEIEVTVGNITGGNDFQDYSYRLYRGENPDPGLQLGPVVGPGGAVTNPQQYAALAPGKYTIEVRQDPAAFGSNCAVYDVVTIDAEALAPLVDITATNANTACDIVTAADGSATININKDANDLTTGFTYAIAVNPAPLGWVNPSPTGPYPPVGLPEVETITGLSPTNIVPQYQITVTSSNNCITQKFVSIPNKPAVAEMVDGNVTILPALYCDPALEVNAMAEVTTLSIIGGGADNISDYEFSWFTDAALTTSVLLNQDGIAGAVKGGEVLSNVGAPLPSSPVTIGSYWVMATKEDAGATGGVGCFSAPFRVDILDNTINPSLTLTASPNTACDINFEGTLQAVVTAPGSVAAVNYTYTWLAVTTPIPSPSISNGDGVGVDDNFSNLQDDPSPYILQVENNSSGCITSAQATITPSAIPIIVANTSHTDQLICNPDGSATVVDVLVGGVADPTHNNFDFTWYKDDPSNEIVAATQGNDLLNLVDFPMVAGTYFVKATRRPLTVPPPTVGSGCESAPVRIEILDASEDPVATLTASPNTSCDTNLEGALQVEVTDPGSVAAVNYTYTWLAVTTPIPSPSVANGDGAGADDNFSNLQDDTNPYILEIENNTSGCKTTVQATITPSAIPIIVANTTHTDQLICNPDGSATVVDVLVGGVADPTHANFDFTWYKDDLTNEIVPATQGNDVLDMVDFTMVAGTYFVKATRRPLTVPPPTVGSGCESAPVRIDILDASEDPDLNFTTVRSDSSCNVLNPMGLVIAAAEERDATIDTYTFTWTYNGGAFHPATVQTDVSPTSQLTNAAAGNYVTVVTNTLTGCTFTQGVTLNLDTLRSLPNIVSVIPTNPVNCFPTGSAEVRSITIGGTTTLAKPGDNLDLPNFNYEWFKGSVPSGLIAGQTTSILMNQLPDSYFTRVTSLSTSCVSALVEVVIDSASIVYPVVAIQQTAPQVSCNVAFGTGILSATADGQNDTNPNYSFTWFPSLDLTGGSISNTSTINGLFSGDYSVRAFNALTNCSSSALFILPNDSTNFFPLLALSSSPLTECDSIDGSISARGLPFMVTANPAENYPFPAYSYTADLYIGSPPADINNPEFPNVPNDPNAPGFTENFLQPNLPDGLYTVRLTDNNTGCITIDTVSIDNLQVIPVPVITQIAPVTNCDPLRANGVARALVNGTFVGYSFEWFEGTIPAGVPLYVGSEYNQLKVAPTQYVVRATNLVTGCSDSTVTTISSGILPIPSPDIEVISHVTSCIINNGALSASVDGNTIDYIFEWFDPPPSFFGELYDSLGVGTYSVTATNRITGCVSPPTSEDIISDPDFPDIDFRIQKAVCGESNGSIALIITSDIAIDTVQWFSDFGTLSGNEIAGAEGPKLSEVLAGDYSVLVTTILGCQMSKDVTIQTEIHPYNGISRNSTPGENDYFHIDCIDNFPQNVVKIYNRAGTLVYEGHGYNNVSEYFDGKSNKGYSPMGTSLPDGTYFYVVDKKDGSKPVAGYLEIVE
ncbi:MAG: gliding motility-associated C-terminal domain-containing protein [Cyclobacteriaceae bacterium]